MDQETVIAHIYKLEANKYSLQNVEKENGIYSFHH